jgi:hypothetical protein
MHVTVFARARPCTRCGSAPTSTSIGTRTSLYQVLTHSHTHIHIHTHTMCTLNAIGFLPLSLFSDGFEAFKSREKGMTGFYVQLLTLDVRCSAFYADTYVPHRDTSSTKSPSSPHTCPRRRSSIKCLSRSSRRLRTASCTTRRSTSAAYYSTEACICALRVHTLTVHSGDSVEQASVAGLRTAQSRKGSKYSLRPRSNFGQVLSAADVVQHRRNSKETYVAMCVIAHIRKVQKHGLKTIEKALLAYYGMELVRLAGSVTAPLTCHR